MVKFLVPCRGLLTLLADGHENDHWCKFFDCWPGAISTTIPIILLSSGFALRCTCRCVSDSHSLAPFLHVTVEILHVLAKVACSLVRWSLPWMCAMLINYVYRTILVTKSLWPRKTRFINRSVEGLEVDWHWRSTHSMMWWMVVVVGLC